MMRLPSVAPWWRQVVDATVTVGSRIKLLRGLGRRRYAAAFARESFVLLLPARGAVRLRDLHGGHLVFGTVGGPIRILGRYHVRLRVGVMERRVDNAGRHTIGDFDAKRRFASAACKLDPVAVADAALLCIMRMHFEQIFLVPQRVVGSPRLRPDIVLREDAAGGEEERETRSGL